MINNKSITNVFILFLILHLGLWTLIPAIFNVNLPLDTIEALAWGSNLDWGYNKHPPLSAFAVTIFYQIFNNQDWAYYLLSQIFVISSFFVVWKLSEDFFKQKILCLISVLLLEGIYLYNFTTPEFNVNICQLPFWTLTVFFCWQSLKNDKILNWVLLGIFAALGFLSKYLFLYLILGIKLFFLYKIFKEKKFNIRYLIPGIVFLILIIPHIMWLSENNYSTIFYGITRSDLNNINLFNHIYNPLTFIVKQIGILIPFLFMSFCLIENRLIKFNIKDKKLIFLIFINISPLLLILLTSILTGAKIRTMWMTPFYLFFGLFIIYIFQKNINVKKLQKFIFVFIFLFILSPTSYLYISTSKTDKRTDFPGKEIAYLVQKRWDNNFSNNISVIIGDEWFGGNLSYHLNSRPVWYNSLNENIKNINIDTGVIYIGNSKILKQICPGLFGIIKPVGICMIGKK
jgi:4-amino-4-deoxy-L-arabinose transferase-like glycosyltransferase